jgi:hypothetical protein
MKLNRFGVFAAALVMAAVPFGAGAQSQAQATPGGDLIPVASVGALRFGGYFWTDTGMLVRQNTASGTFDQNSPYMQGRLGVITAFSRSGAGLDYDAQLELIGLDNEYSNSAYEPHVLNAYLKVGQKRWDVQIGRFLNSEVYYRGQGIELYTAEEAGALHGPGLYHLQFTRGHQNQPGQAAVHLRPADNVMIELSGVYGQESNQNWYGARPMVDVGYAGFRLFAGYEYLKKTPNSDQFVVESTQQGYAARLQYAVKGLTLGVNYARADLEELDNNGDVDTFKTLDRTSIGGFADLDFWQSSVGLGYHLTTDENTRGLPDTTRHHQAFVSYLYRLPVEGLSVKGVFGFARADVEDRSANAEWQNDMTSFRVRVAYDFQ